MHRNAQKRFYNKGHLYFVTFVTLDRYPWFAPSCKHHQVFCDLMVRQLRISSVQKQFRLMAYTIMGDHVHALVKPTGRYNISDAIHSVKRHFARDANVLLGYTKGMILSESQILGNEGEDYDGEGNEGEDVEGEDSYPRLHNETPRLHKFEISPRLYDLPKFSWQKSFHDHVIRGEIDYMNHMRYIKYNHILHSQEFGYGEEWKYTHINGFLL